MEKFSPFIEYSKNQIFTIGHLLALLEMYPNWQEYPTAPALTGSWWDSLVERYNPEEDHEEWLHGDAEYEYVEEEDGGYWEDEDIQYENPPDDVWEGIELAHNQRIRHIILEHLNTLPNADARDQFRDAVENIFERFGGNIAELEDSV